MHQTLQVGKTKVLTQKCDIPVRTHQKSVRQNNSAQSASSYIYMFKMKVKVYIKYINNGRAPYDTYIAIPIYLYEAHGINILFL